MCGSSTQGEEIYEIEQVNAKTTLYTSLWQNDLVTHSRYLHLKPLLNSKQTLFVWWFICWTSVLHNPCPDRCIFRILNGDIQIQYLCVWIGVCIYVSIQTHSPHASCKFPPHLNQVTQLENVYLHHNSDHKFLFYTLHNVWLLWHAKGQGGAISTRKVFRSQLGNQTI